MNEKQRDPVAAIAHEMNNLLSPIATAAEILKRSMPLDGDAAYAVQTIERQVARLAALVDDLRRLKP